MNQLVKVKRNELLIDSRQIARGVGVGHHAVMVLIDKYKDDIEYFGKLRFSHLKLENPQGGRPEKVYHLTEPQATFLITLSRNTRQVVEFKKQMTDEFYKMRQSLLEKQSVDWRNQRLSGIKQRNEFTGTICNVLIPYAQEQGAYNPAMLYMAYTKMINHALDIPSGDRSWLSRKHLRALEILEEETSEIIIEEIIAGEHYKQIFKDCKTRCNEIAGAFRLPSVLTNQKTIETCPV
jgi:phage regulator Rha-like protein